MLARFSLAHSFLPRPLAYLKKCYVYWPCTHNILVLAKIYTLNERELKICKLYTKLFRFFLVVNSFFSCCHEGNCGFNFFIRDVLFNLEDIFNWFWANNTKLSVVFLNSRWAFAFAFPFPRYIKNIKQKIQKIL